MTECLKHHISPSSMLFTASLGRGAPVGDAVAQSDVSAVASAV